jgi:hypothetical protein
LFLEDGENAEVLSVCPPALVKTGAGGRKIVIHSKLMKDTIILFKSEEDL